MAEITLSSPGVQINEEDISIISRPSGSTDVLVTGFADQGPTEDIVNITSLSEFEQVYGTPKNAAERYFYHTAKQLLLTSPANLLVSRVPYGSGAGEGYANTYSALIYQLSANAPTYEAATNFQLKQPVSLLISEAEYKKLSETEKNEFKTIYDKLTTTLNKKGYLNPDITSMPKKYKETIETFIRNFGDEKYKNDKDINVYLTKLSDILERVK
jgi:hypothetical protein